MFILPKTPAELAALQRVRRREAFEKARRSRLLGPRLTGIRAQHLDDDDEWRRIPLLTKEDLRALPAADFHDAFCISPRSAISEYWRSGGVTGKPTFYGRSATDMIHVIESFRRVWYAIGAVPGDGVHVSFPLGIHPIGSIIARSAQIHGMSTVWAGAGNTTPSELQLELLQTLRPTIWAGMSSYCLHLANVAETKGIDLTRLTIRKVLVSAEQLTDAKRAKIARTWGAEVYDCLGMTEGGLMIAETAASKPAMAAWADLFYFEVVNEETGFWTTNALAVGGHLQKSSGCPQRYDEREPKPRGRHRHRGGMPHDQRCCARELDDHRREDDERRAAQMLPLISRVAFGADAGEQWIVDDLDEPRNAAHHERRCRLDNEEQRHPAVPALVSSVIRPCSRW